MKNHIQYFTIALLITCHTIHCMEPQEDPIAADLKKRAILLQAKATELIQKLGDLNQKLQNGSKDIGDIEYFYPPDFISKNEATLFTNLKETGIPEYPYKMISTSADSHYESQIKMYKENLEWVLRDCAHGLSMIPLLHTLNYNLCQMANDQRNAAMYTSGRQFFDTSYNNLPKESDLEPNALVKHMRLIAAEKEENPAKNK